MQLAAELPAQIIEQTSEFNIGTAFVGSDVVRPVIIASGSIFGYGIFIMSVCIDRATFEVSHGAGGLGSRVEGTGTYLGHQ